MCAKCNQLLIFLDANSRPRAPASVHSRVNKIMLGQRRKAGSGQRRPQLHRKKPDVSISGRRGPRARIVYDIGIFEHEKTVGNEEGTVLFVQQHTIFIVVSTMIVLQSDHAAVFQPKCNGTSEVRSSESSLLRPQLRQRPGRGVFVIRVVCQQVLEADQQAARSVFHVRKACVTTLDVL